jgi:mannose-6-phosphate isomerase-like protein (cupin superfamily)
MLYVRPFQIDGPAGPGPEWLIAPSEAAECSIRVCRVARDGGRVAPAATERFLFVIKGCAELMSAEGDSSAESGEVIFIPPGTSAEVEGEAGTVWLDIEAVLPTGVTAPVTGVPRVVKLDRAEFEGEGFAWQVMLDRNQGAHSLRLNVVKVQPGSGSPDFHIHAFGQFYVIQEGTMTIDVGRARYKANANTVVYLPAGVVHRNFNGTGEIEQHMSLLIPEPAKGEIFDYAVTIHDHEAKMLTQVPA